MGPTTRLNPYRLDPHIEEPTEMLNSKKKFERLEPNPRFLHGNIRQN